MNLFNPSSPRTPVCTYGAAILPRRIFGAWWAAFLWDDFQSDLPDCFSSRSRSESVGRRSICSRRRKRSRCRKCRDVSANLDFWQIVADFRIGSSFVDSLFLKGMCNSFLVEIVLIFNRKYEEKVNGNLVVYCSGFGFVTLCTST